MTETQKVPTVAYPVGRSRVLGGALALLWLTGAMIAWLCWPGQDPGRSVPVWQPLSLLLALAVTACALRVFWRDQMARKLVFDGDQWHLEDLEVVADVSEHTQVAVVLDLQMWMLLRCSALPRDGRSVKWLWAEASSDPLRWHLLRCALYSPANSPIGSTAGGPLKHDSLNRGSAG